MKDLVEASVTLNTEQMKPKIKNQNYTVVPENSEYNITPPSQKGSTQTLWDGCVTKQPDEDTRHELNLPEINMGVFKSIFDK